MVSAINKINIGLTVGNSEIRPNTEPEDLKHDYMKIRILIPLLLLCNLSRGQFGSQILNYCRENKSDVLINLIDSIEKIGEQETVYYEAYQDVNRQIISDYYETILYYEENKTNYFDYTIQIISENNNIVYCKVFQTKFVDKPDTVYSFLNEKKILALQDQYYETYGNIINIKDFFDNSVIYGTRCSHAASQPEYRTLCEIAIQEQNLSLLNLWLTSVTTEKQLYSVEAFSRLENKGLILTEKQKALIGIVKNKTGTVRCCAGCSFKSWQIQDAWKLALK